MKKVKVKFFLIELVINSLMFTICAAICLNLFVQGYTQSKDARQLSMATLVSQNTAELIKAYNADLPIEMISEEIDDVYYVYYNEDWQITNKDTQSFVLSYDANLNEGLLTSVISVKDKDEEIYSLKVKKYIGEESINNG